MNTDYQTVAAGTITPLNVELAESTNELEVHKYQEERAERLSKMEDSRVLVEITTEFPGYQSLGDGAWRHQIVERICKAVVARTNSRLEYLNPMNRKLYRKSPIIYLAWDRLHHNDSGKPVYIQRWYIEKADLALLGYQGRLGEESFADIILATWHAGWDSAQSWVSKELRRYN